MNQETQIIEKLLFSQTKNLGSQDYEKRKSPRKNYLEQLNIRRMD